MSVNKAFPDDDLKSCERCGASFTRPQGVSTQQWSSRRFCSKRCSAMRRTVGDDEILALYALGKSSTEIAPLAGVTPEQVARVVARYGVTRSASEAHRLAGARPDTKARMSAAAKGRPCPEHVKATLRSLTGRKNPLWVCGLTIGAGGYLQFTSSHGNGDHAGRFLHQIIAEQKIGRRLLPGEHVHHVDEDKLNNHPDNLEVMSAAEHGRLHAQTNQFWNKRAA